MMFNGVLELCRGDAVGWVLGPVGHFRDEIRLDGGAISVAYDKGA